MNGIDAREYLDSGKKYLRVQNIRPFEIVLDSVKYVETESTKDVMLKAGDVLLTRKGTFGVAAVVTDEFIDCLISSEIILLRLSEGANCSPDYLAAWLNSKAGQVLLDRHKSGGIMGHVTQDVVNMFPIPLPSDEIQKSIADELSRRRGQARRLREEGESGWREAKVMFEKKLLEG
jgi:restriction endonuclease S subunit